MKNKLDDVVDFVLEYYLDDLWVEDLLNLLKNRKQFNKFVLDRFGVDVEENFVFLDEGGVVFTIDEVVFARKHKISINKMLDFFDKNLDLSLKNKKTIKIEEFLNNKK